MDRDPRAWWALVKRKTAPQAMEQNFPHHQPVVIDGVVVEDVVLLEVPGVGAEVVVHGKVAHLNGGVGDNVFGIDRGFVPGRG